jgi:hypothetical protein
MNEHTRRQERGQSLVEMTVIVVILIIVLGGLADLGRSFIILAAVENAAGEGALYGATHPDCLSDVTAPCGTDPSVVERVKREAEDLLITLSDDKIVAVIELDGAGEGFCDTSAAEDIVPPNVLCVNVTYDYSPLTPIGFLIWGDTATVRANARQKVMAPPRP